MALCFSPVQKLNKAGIPAYVLRRSIERFMQKATASGKTWPRLPRKEE